MKWLWFGLASAAGGFCRYSVREWVSGAGSAWPWGTFAVNVTGCFAIGFLDAFAAQEGWLSRDNVRLVLMGGFCGAYTTFSALMLETSILVREHRWLELSFYVLGSLFAGFLLFRLGEWCGQRASFLY